MASSLGKDSDWHIDGHLALSSPGLSRRECVKGKKKLLHMITLSPSALPAALLVTNAPDESV